MINIDEMVEKSRKSFEEALDKAYENTKEYERTNFEFKEQKKPLWKRILKGIGYAIFFIFNAIITALFGALVIGLGIKLGDKFKKK